MSGTYSTDGKLRKINHPFFNHAHGCLKYDITSKNGISESTHCHSDLHAPGTVSSMQSPRDLKHATSPRDLRHATWRDGQVNIPDCVYVKTNVQTAIHIIRNSGKINIRTTLELAQVHLTL